MGEAVRYDGATKARLDLVEALEYAATPEELVWVRVCPEVGAGYGVPREPISLERHGTALRLITRETRIDRTEAMEAFARAEINRLTQLKICGFVFKSRSPSCGISDVPLMTSSGVQEGQPGLFARRLRDDRPALPLIDENGLDDPALRRKFIDRARAYRATQGP